MKALKNRFTPSVERPFGSGRRAFTLIELLIVIGIIGILASLLLPTLGRAKAQARRVRCISNQKQWALALRMYANDNDDELPRESFLPGGTTINLWSQVRNPLARDVWYNALPALLGQQTAANYSPPTRIPDFYDRRLMFHCPGASFPKNDYRVPLFSIAMNSKLTLSTNSTVRMSSIEKGRPSDTVVFLDNLLEGERKVDALQAKTELGQPSAYASRFVVRHPGGGVMAFADGHAGSVPGDQVVDRRGLAFFPQHNILWTADPSVDPNQ